MSFAERLFAGRWIAGPGINDAMRISKAMNSANITPILNYLGEDLAKRSEVSDSVSEYINLINAIHESGVKAVISLKPSQLGLSISYALAQNNYSRIAKIARKNGVFTWLDMEGHNTVADTKRMYYSELRRGRVGICMQAYLRRTGNDIEELLSRDGIIRLVKGAYKEDANTAFTTRAQITQNYAELMHRLFKSSAQFMIATHDPAMINLAFRLSKKTGKRPMYAMLNGIRNNYATKLAKREHVFLYLPFGRSWLPYASRRLREEGHLLLMVRSLFEKQDLV